MKRIRIVLACVFAVVLMGVGSAGPVFADKASGPEKAIATSVNINKANAEELASALFNIGESKSEAIVKYREENGTFTSKEQLLNIKGIGKSTLEKNEALITL